MTTGACGAIRNNVSPCCIHSGLTATRTMSFPGRRGTAVPRSGRKKRPNISILTIRIERIRIEIRIIIWIGEIVTLIEMSGIPINHRIESERLRAGLGGEIQQRRASERGTEVAGL